MKAVVCKQCGRVLPVTRSSGAGWWLTAELCPVHPAGGFTIVDVVGVVDAQEAAA